MWRVPAFEPQKKNLTWLTPTPFIDVWWDREAKNRSDELLFIRQQDDKQVDLLRLNFGQAYDLLEALVRAIKDY